jgi:hypothetical protein
MGMYTAFHFNVELKSDVPLSVLTILKYMVRSQPGEQLQVSLPNHPLFSETRWRFMLQCDSYYFSEDTYSTIRYDEIGSCWYLCIRCNFKNYSNEIELFLNWIDPYLANVPGDFLGFYRYEEAREPTLIYKP